MTRAVLLLVVGAVLVGRSGDVCADEDPLARPTSNEARAALERGEALYNLQKWDEAIVELEKGALLEPELPLWFLSLGQAHRKAGHYERARWYFERFLSRIEVTPNTEEIVATVQGLIEDMKAAESNPPVELAPTSTLDSGDPSLGDDPSPMREPSRWTASRKVALGLGVAGVIAVGAGSVLSLRAQGFEDDAAELCPMVMCADAAAANDLARRSDENRRNATVLYGVGGAAAVGAAILWYVGAPTQSADRAMTATARLAPHSVGIDFMMRF